MSYWKRHSLSSAAQDTLAGALTGALSVIMAVSFAVLIFSGRLEDYLPQGMMLTLWTAACGPIVIGLMSGFTHSIAIPQDRIAPLLAVLSASLLALIPAGISDQTAFYTVTAAIIISTIVTALVLILLGHFRMGSIVRFIPFPVIGGFLAGTGFLLVLGSLKVMTGKPLSFANLPELVASGETLAKWLPGTAFAVLLLAAMQRIRHHLTMPAMILLAVGGFYLYTISAGVTTAELQKQGLLLALDVEQFRLSPLTPHAILHAEWGYIFEEINVFFTIVVVSLISLLLNATAIEMAHNEDVDLDRELKITGLANLFTGGWGGMIGFHSLSLTLLSRKLGSNSRLTGVVAGLTAVAVILGGMPIMNRVPVPVLGGLLMFLGLSLLKEWLVDIRKRIPLGDYSTIVLILLVIIGFGYLEGVAAGLAAAVALFVLHYSRIDVVKHAFSGAHHHSGVDRPISVMNKLSENGDKVLVLILRDYLFFGSANRILNKVTTRIKDEGKAPLCYLILDFELVSGMDSTAVASLLKIRRLCMKHKITLLLSGLSPKAQQTLVEETFWQPDEKRDHVYEEMESALEWCESQILGEIETTDNGSEWLKEQLREYFANPDDYSCLMEHTRLMKFSEGQDIVGISGFQEGIYLIADGEVDVEFVESNTGAVHSRRIRKGAVLGEMGLLLNNYQYRSAITRSPTRLYGLDREILAHLETDHPHVSIGFYRYMMHSLCLRLVLTQQAIANLR